MALAGARQELIPFGIAGSLFVDGPEDFAAGGGFASRNSQGTDSESA